MKAVAALVGLFLLFPFLSGGAWAAEPLTGDPVHGKTLAVEKQCYECHGASGEGLQPGWPKLAGQHERYLLNQMDNFRDGRRLHYFMEIFATVLNRQDMMDLAAYFHCLGIEEIKTARCTTLAKELGK